MNVLGLVDWYAKQGEMDDTISYLHSHANIVSTPVKPVIISIIT